MERATPTVTGDIRLYPYGHLRGPVTFIPIVCPAFGSGAVTTYFNESGLLRPGLEQTTFRMRGKCLTAYLRTTTAVSIYKIC